MAISIARAAQKCMRWATQRSTSAPFEAVQQAERAFYNRYLHPTMVIFDVGANIGLYTLLAAEQLRGRGAVYSFEPNPEVFFCLSRNAERNNFANVNIPEPERAAMILQFDLAARINRFLPFPVVFHRGVLDHQFTIQKHVDLVACHHDPETIPFAHRIVRCLEGVARILFVIVQAP